jgi:hypothetical protein
VKLFSDMTTNYPILLLKDVLDEKYNIVFDDKNYDILISGPGYPKDIEKIKKDSHSQNALKIFMTWEAATPDLNFYDFAIGFDFIDSPKYIRAPLAYSFYKDKVSTNFSRNMECNPRKKHFACFLVSNGAINQNNGLNNKPFDGSTARIRLFHQLSLYKNVLSGGKYLNNIGGPLDGSKNMEWLSQCKFTIAYENQKHNGYITEKPFQAWLAGTIPLYYGDKSVLSGINKDALIYADDFASENELVEYIKKVDNDDELYCKIWNQHIVNNPNQNYEALKNNLSKKIDELFAQKLKKNTP